MLLFPTKLSEKFDIDDIEVFFVFFIGFGFLNLRKPAPPSTATIPQQEGESEKDRIKREKKEKEESERREKARREEDKKEKKKRNKELKVFGVITRFLFVFSLRLSFKRTFGTFLVVRHLWRILCSFVAAK